MARDVIRAILDSNMAEDDKSEIIRELIRLDYMRHPKETEKIIRDYVQRNPYPKTRQ